MQECTNVVKAVYALIVNTFKCWLEVCQAHLYDVLLKEAVIYIYCLADFTGSCPSLHTCILLMFSVYCSWLIIENVLC